MRDSAWVQDVVREVEPEVVMHLGAQALVRRSDELPTLTFETNVVGTVNLLEAIRGLDSVQAVLVVTSDKVYRNDESGQSFRENDPLGGDDPYSASKACQELVSHAYASSYWSEGLPVLGTARAGNVVGGGDWSADRLLPDIFRALAAGEPLIVRNPRARRPWQHILGLVAGYLSYAQLLVSGGRDVPRSLNFGPDLEDVRPVSWVVEQLTKEWSDESQLKVDESPNLPEAHTLSLSSELARRTLSWKPRLPLRQALQWSAVWHSAYERGSDMRRFSLEQISQYERLPK
jgi:CDP-glucose 4,6-dehydratase